MSLSLTKPKPCWSGEDIVEARVPTAGKEELTLALQLKQAMMTCGGGANARLVLEKFSSETISRIGQRDALKLELQYVLSLVYYEERRLGLASQMLDAYIKALEESDTPLLYKTLLKADASILRRFRDDSAFQSSRAQKRFPWAEA